MFWALSILIPGRKIMPRLIITAVGAIGTLAFMQITETRAQEAPFGGFEVELTGASAEMFKLVRTSFPEDYAALNDALKLAIKTGGDVQAATYDHLLAIRLKYAPNIARADDASLAALADSTVAVYRALIDGEGPEFCAQFATQGAAAFAGTDRQALYEEVIMEQAVTMFRAAKSGMDNPVQRPAASDADWQTVVEDSLLLGADTGSYQAMANGEAAVGVCPSLIGFFSATSGQGDAAGALVRAEFLAMVSTEV